MKISKSNLRLYVLKYIFKKIINIISLSKPYEIIFLKFKSEIELIKRNVDKKMVDALSRSFNNDVRETISKRNFKRKLESIDYSSNARLSEYITNSKFPKERNKNIFAAFGDKSEKKRLLKEALRKSLNRTSHIDASISKFSSLTDYERCNIQTKCSLNSLSGELNEMKNHKRLNKLLNISYCHKCGCIVKGKNSECCFECYIKHSGLYGFEFKLYKLFYSNNMLYDELYNSYLKYIQLEIEYISINEEDSRMDFEFDEDGPFVRLYKITNIPKAIDIINDIVYGRTESKRFNKLCEKSIRYVDEIYTMY